MTIAWLAVAYSVKATMDPVWWVRGVALGLVVTNLVAVELRLWGLNRRLGGVDLKRVATTYAKSAAGALLAAVAGVGVLIVGPDSWNQGGPTAVMTSVGMSAAIGTTMVVVYAVAARFFKITEATDVARAVTRRVRRVR
jgi:putative peptidoglycan lipid II flippase